MITETKYIRPHDPNFTHLTSTLDDVKMHTSFLISTLLGAGALASPQHKHAHLHEKRDAVFYTQWQDGPHTLIQEYINEDNGVSNVPPPASTSAAVEVKADYAFHPGGHHSWAGEEGKQYENERPAAPMTTTAAVSQAPAPIITPQAVSSTPSAPAIVQASPIDTPPASSSSSSSSSSAPEPSTSDTTTSTSSGACNPTGGDAWYSPPCTGSSAASSLDKMNALRNLWNSTLTNYTWDSGLAQNAYDTAWLATTWTAGTDSAGHPTETPDGEGRGWVMGHHMFNGTNGQCIAEGDNTASVGDLTPVEAMFLMWLCEKPSASIESMCTATGNTGGNSTCYCADIEDDCSCGHAMIIQDLGLNSIGCYYMYKVAEGKTDAAVNALETAQELGSADNDAPGLFTCDFTKRDVVS